jgi:hypothetical protein
MNTKHLIKNEKMNNEQPRLRAAGFQNFYRTMQNSPQSGGELTPKEIRNIKINSFLLFSPFLILYILISIVFPTNGLGGDEPRYIHYATNLLNGYYSLPFPNIDLSNGPGYPLILAPFLYLKLPLILVSFLNAILHYLSIILLFKALQSIISYKNSLIVSLFWAFNYNLYLFIPMVLTEILSSFLISLLIFSLNKSFDHSNLKQSKLYTYISGLSLGYLILTKTIFFYVLLFLLGSCIILWIINTRKINYRKSIVILSIAMLIASPYLIYTYYLTGRVFYVTNKASNLYWMSSPYKHEYGDWFSMPWTNTKNVLTNQSKSTFPFDNPYILSDTLYNQIKINHKQDYDDFAKLNGMTRDEYSKKLAIKNIKTHPLKYIKNIIYNTGRLFFNIPYSYKLETPRSLIWFPFDGIIAVLMIISLFPTILNWRKIPFSLRFLILFAFIYLGGSLLLSAQPRMLTFIMPILLFWTAFVLNRSIKFNIRFKEDNF